MQSTTYKSNLEFWQKINSGSIIEEIENLHPGDKLFIKAPDQKPEWYKHPEVLTIRKIDVSKSEVYLKEISGVCLKENRFLKIFQDALPEPGDKVKFQLEEKSAQGFSIFNSYTSEVFDIEYDPTKSINPKCIVEVNGKKIGVDLYSVEKIQEQEPVKETLENSFNQLSLF